MKAISALLILMMSASAATAQSSDWQKTWDQTLAAAKKEGKVVIVGSPDLVMRDKIIPKFTQRFGILVEYIAGSSGPIAARVSTERQSDIYSVDIYLSGAQTALHVLLPGKMLDPLKPLLVLPEVTEGHYWKRGKPWFADAEGQYMLMLFSSAEYMLFINEEYVKRSEMRSARDLVNPKWKGKIATDDPMGSATGAGRAADLYAQLGPEFIRKLYVDQQPGISRDRRQLNDWLARGNYPICLTCREVDTRALQQAGYKLHEVFELEGIRNRTNSAPFLMSLANKAPHPNAARIFANWMASKEVLELYSRGDGATTLRSDVDESFLDPKTIPKPGVAYADVTDPEWVMQGRTTAIEKVREIIRAARQ